jgi:hypothetical protein
MNNSVKRKTLSKKVIVIISTIVLIILIPILWFAYTTFSPKPLGDKLEYIGKRDYGCIIFCDSKPGSVYYYATDMNPDEMTKYFSKATPVNIDRVREWRNERESFWLDLKNNQSKEPFNLIYYFDTVNKISSLKLQSSNKPYVIKINSSQYNAIRDSI